MFTGLRYAVGSGSDRARWQAAIANDSEKFGILQSGAKAQEVGIRSRA